MPISMSSLIFHCSDQERSSDISILCDIKYSLHILSLCKCKDKDALKRIWLGVVLWGLNIYYANIINANVILEYNEEQ